MLVSIIDDSREVLLLVELCLTKIGLDSICFRNPEEALEQIPIVKPDVVLVDYLMFDMDGIELIKKLREKNVKSKFIIFTSMEETDIQPECESNNIIFMKKPSSCNELKGMLVNICQS